MLGFSYVDIASVVNANERTVRQRVAPRGSHCDKIEQLGELKHLLLALIGNSDTVAAWMKTPLPRPAWPHPRGGVSGGQGDEAHRHSRDHRVGRLPLTAGLVGTTFDGPVWRHIPFGSERLHLGALHAHR